MNSSQSRGCADRPAQNNSQHIGRGSRGWQRGANDGQYLQRGSQKQGWDAERSGQFRIHNTNNLMTRFAGGVGQENNAGRQSHDTKLVEDRPNSGIIQLLSLEPD